MENLWYKDDVELEKLLQIQKDSLNNEGRTYQKKYKK